MHSDPLSDGCGLTAIVGGSVSALFGAVEPTSLLAQGGFWIGLGGLVGVVMGRVAPFVATWLDQRKARQDAEISLKRLALERRMETLEYRAWMLNAAHRHGLTLPEGFDTEG